MQDLLQPRIYLDHHAATPLSDAAREAMQRALSVPIGNPSSIHSYGRLARSLVEQARSALAKAIGARERDVVFTAGGTEAVNLACAGVWRGRSNARVLLMSAVEHPAAAEFANRLGDEGRAARFEVRAGRVPSASELAAQLAGVDMLVVQWVNHETGTTFPLEEYAAVAARLGVAFVVDATQAFGKLPIDHSRIPNATLALASQKIGGPAGAGAVVVGAATKIEPLMVGGGQERGLRPGTPDVVCLAGFGAACETIPDRIAAQPRLAALRDRLETQLIACGGLVNGLGHPRCSTVSNASFVGKRGDVMVAALDAEGVAASSGAACSSGLQEPSRVLRAMYPEDPERAISAVRVSVGPETTDVDVDAACKILARVLRR